MKQKRKEVHVIYHGVAERRLRQRMIMLAMLVILIAIPTLCIVALSH